MKNSCFKNIFGIFILFNYAIEYENYLAKISELTEPNILEYEKISQTTFAVSENTNILLDFQGNVISQNSREYEILNIRFLYNK
ncbi:MAG: hypothetical protein K9H16_04070 [Bacteroidales bacterium]|nr:hypothetical protein [Bacteroidales bacterium]